MCKRADAAVQCFNNGFNCSQAVFSSFCEELGLDKETGLKIACAFGGGMGHINETCGAVTGAFMSIGLKNGKSKEDDMTSKDRTYTLVKEFTKRFKAEFGSVRCTDLVHYNLSIPDELTQARKAGVFDTVCPRLVKRAVEISEEIL